MQIYSIVDDLRYNSNLLPKEVIRSSKDTQSLVVELQAIMNKYKDELVREELFRQNYINIINYIYQEMFREDLEKRNKKLFSQSFIESVFSLPARA